MKQKLEKYINEELRNITKWGFEAEQDCTRCYGAVMFAGNYCGDPAEREEIFSWWDDEIHPKFRELGAC